MLLPRTIPSILSSAATVRHHSSAAKTPKSLSKIHSSAAKTPKSLSKIPLQYRAKAIQQAQEALTDYLHAVRAIPYTYAENISKYSIVSLSSVISKVKFSTSDFSKSLQRFFRYNPVDEFELFFESIGIGANELDGFLPARKFFLSEDPNAFNAACVLYGFGIPWNNLGMLYKEEKTIFDKDPFELKEIWRRYMNCGFTSSSLIGICLVFPHLLNGDCEVDILFNDLKKIVIDFDLISDVEGNVDSWIEICRKIRMFYDLGSRKSDIWDLMGRSKKILVQYPEEILAEKIEYFCRFHVTNEEVTSLLLLGPKIFEIDLKNPFFCVVGLLRHCGLSEEHLNSVIKKYPYVFGRNRLANLPPVMRALNLNQWFFDKIKDGGHNLLTSYTIGSSNQDFDQDFAENMVMIQSSRYFHHTFSKLEFLHGIGYGENGFTVKVLKHIQGTSNQLQERFNCLIHNGIEFSNLCKMVSLSPKILNQQSEFLEKKVEFLCDEIGLSLNYLDVFPAYLCFDLEKRIKPRYRFHMWLMETGLCEREYSPASIVATSEMSFIARIYRIHPAAPKKWLELFMNRDYASFQENS